MLERGLSQQEAVEVGGYVSRGREKGCAGERASRGSSGMCSEETGGEDEEWRIAAGLAFEEI